MPTDFERLHSPTILAAERIRRVQTAYQLLWEAYADSQELRRDPWDFAVEIEQLHQAGLSNSDLRGLIVGGYVLHAFEETRRNEPTRSFRPLVNLRLGEGTCFVLTPKGVHDAWKLGRRQVHSGLYTGDAAPAGTRASELVPEWDSHRGRLTCRGILVKQFRQPAPHQRLILDTFHKRSWPFKIEDPLPIKVRGVASKKRLDYAIQGLNRDHQHVLLHFGGDGSGRGIRWWVINSSTPKHP